VLVHVESAHADDYVNPSDAQEEQSDLDCEAIDLDAADKDDSCISLDVTSASNPAYALQ
jgi:hypothetical protein